MAPLWLHAYSGRENGLMVIGDHESLQALGRQLLDAKPGGAVAVPGWPQQVASPLVVGPYGDIRNFRLSFHIKGDSVLEEMVPIPRRALRFPVLIVVAILALVGVLTILQWIASVL